VVALINKDKLLGNHDAKSTVLEERRSLSSMPFA